VLATELKKSIFDLALAVPGFLVASPLLCFIALVVRLSMGKPVLFKQARPGKDAKPFLIYKFRTMNNARGPDGELLPDSNKAPLRSEKITWFGSKR